MIVVAGMHRAGTSVVARGLLALGADLGDSLMSADVRMNAKGFFEDVDIVELDDALLETCGADWKNLAILDDVDWTAPRHAAARDAARRLLEVKLARSGQFAFKDPRVPRLLPFWQAVFAELAFADAYVIAVRHPQAVVDSLRTRDGLDERRCAWLWLTHLVCALRYTQGRRRVVVDYDRLIASPATEVARMGRALEFGQAPDDPSSLATYERDFISPALRHAEYPAGLLAAPYLPPGAAGVHALAQRLAADESDPDDPAVQEEVDAHFRALMAFGPLLAYAGSVERAADALPTIAGELAWARSSLAEASDYVGAAIGPKDEYIADLTRELARKDSELVAAHALLDKLTKDLQDAYALLDRLRQDLVGRLLLRRLR
ncbi:MAG: hypothetical protein U1F10_05695 [Burkholderiales bacterium]